MGYAIGTDRRGKVEGRTVVNQAPILGPEEDLSGDFEVGAAAIDECSASLRRGPRCVRRIKHQTPNARLGKRCEAPPRMAINISRSHFVLVRLHSQRTARQSIRLRVERITLIQFHTVIVREEETIAGQHTAAVRCALLDSVVGRALHETLTPEH